VQALIGKTGKEALKRRIFERDLEAIDYTSALEAGELIEEFKKEEIEIISKAASVFYSWVSFLKLRFYKFIECFNAIRNDASK